MAIHTGTWLGGVGLLRTWRGGLSLVGVAIVSSAAGPEEMRAAAWGVVALLCALSLGQRPTEEARCGPGLTSRGTGPNARCCHSCETTTGQTNCEGCKCVQIGYHCGEPKCDTCKPHPCNPGQEVVVQGIFNFGFKCVDCAPGTFSDDRSGLCKSKTNCSMFGFSTLFPGNKTHNAVCSSKPPAESCSLLTLALLVMAACILVLVVVHLGLRIWELKRTRMCYRGIQQPPEVSLPEDAHSYQLPEEERGGQQAEEKGRLENLWV
ncbi:PREDICTED: tumor necrosis factor receptor superfamily member 18 [Elephantulus edwardii]|uniref:tumor necrosis factor receptor superfamily member 18 n=1 Tax=Elephantulus edwardii TaxID=28737 RepID=UPI0003F0C856|nr:PREDICTED: tumor necrosis factor receptor superfamily member 18 [Elephantulus edwardii]